MQKLQFALFQADEAKKYLLEGSLPALRLSLIVLDNAAEILLDRWIEKSIASDAFWSGLQESAKEVGIPETHPDFRELFRRSFLSASEQRQVARFFDEKLRYVTEIKHEVPDSVGNVLSHLHRFRNEAYHAATVNTETLRTSIMIQLELFCILLTSLKASAGYGSNEDFSWLKQRFNIRPDGLWDDETLEKIASEYRENLSNDNKSLRETLAQNLESRLQDVFDQLDFIADASYVEMDRAIALNEAQKFALQELERTPVYGSVPKKLKEPVSLEQLEALRLNPADVRSASDSMTAFEAFAASDLILDRIEFMTGQLGSAIDRQIQLEIDIARGK